MVDLDPDAMLVERIGRSGDAATRVFVPAKLPRITEPVTRMLRVRTGAEDGAHEAF